MANYDKDMAEERIQIRDDKQKIYEDDRKKRDGMSMMGKATMGDRMSPLNYSGNNMKLQSGMNMNANLAYNPVEDIAGQGTEGVNTGMMMKKEMTPMNNLNKGYGQQVGKPSVASRNKYGGNKGDESMSKRDYSSPAKMYGGKKGDMSKSRRDY
tara:strand:- start:86 stop:547 length:462 start_codon:yes stop_codon:yes gene_type:complete